MTQDRLTDEQGKSLTQEQIDEGERFALKEAAEWEVRAPGDYWEAWIDNHKLRIFATIRTLQARVRELEGKLG